MADMLPSRWEPNPLTWGCWHTVAWATGAANTRGQHQQVLAEAEPLGCGEEAGPC